MNNNQPSNPVGVVVGSVFLGCFLAIIVALTIKIIQWMF
jgi:hypothetical protein